MRAVRVQTLTATRWSWARAIPDGWNLLSTLHIFTVFHCSCSCILPDGDGASPQEGATPPSRACPSATPRWVTGILVAVDSPAGASRFFCLSLLFCLALTFLGDFPAGVPMFLFTPKERRRMEERLRAQARLPPCAIRIPALAMAFESRSHSWCWGFAVPGHSNLDPKNT